MIESYVRARLKKKEILLMAHIVLGYPSFEACFKIIGTMVKAGVDLMELQVPFSEPTADGPVILRANHRALQNGVTVKECLDFARKATRAFHIPFLIMGYYNILFKYGLERFAASLAEKRIQGTIIPDLPPEEAGEYLSAMQEHRLAPVFIFAPTTPEDRLRYIASFARGFVYCVARKGVTGANTNFSDDLTGFLDRCRRATSLPLALGFGVTRKADVDYLKGKADIAVVGTQTIRIMEREGIESVGRFIAHLNGRN